MPDLTMPPYSPVEPANDVVTQHDDEPVYFDTVRGHVRVGELTFADLGNATLSVWSHQGCTLTPTSARDLATALTAWVSRWDQKHAHLAIKETPR